MSHGVLASAGRTFDALERRWESVATQRRLATVLVATFVVTLVVID